MARFEKRIIEPLLGDEPVRLDMFGSELESIRTSLEHILEEVRLSVVDWRAMRAR